MVHASHNALFAGQFIVMYDKNEHLCSVMTYITMKCPATCV
jgi:hypothetical protein